MTRCFVGPAVGMRILNVTMSPCDDPKRTGGRFLVEAGVACTVDTAYKLAASKDIGFAVDGKKWYQWGRKFVEVQIHG